MLEFLTDITTAFTLGLLTPLTAVCVLPLYPAFLVYLSNLSKKPAKHAIRNYGIIISLGVIAFMFLLGLIFTTVLQVSLTHAILVISPIAFTILAVISLFLIFDIDIGSYLPKPKTPVYRNPLVGAFLYGFFFGAIVIPCNPLFIAVLFTKTVAVMDFARNLISFLFFGIGLTTPLIAFSLIPTESSAKVISYITKHKKKINFSAGAIMLVIALYYLIFVFRVHDVIRGYLL
jgi:cytochrome c-type biogenesis protein